MKTARKIWLVVSALYDLARYDVTNSLRGSGLILQQLRRQTIATRQVRHESVRDEIPERELERTICDVVLLATCFYWKPVLCLQRSVCTVRLLRRHGIVARLMIGFRPSPFFSHAWVEVDGRVVYGSPAYQKRLTLLHVA